MQIRRARQKQQYRNPGISSLPEEAPNEQDRSQAETSLEASNRSIDIVPAHHATPTSPENATQRLELHPHRCLNDQLKDIDKKLPHDTWFYGHYHVDTALKSK